MTLGTLKRVASTDRGVSPPPAKRKLTTNTTNKAIANFFKPTSEKAKDTEICSFHIVDNSLLVGHYTGTEASSPKPTEAVPHRQKIAAFDFDDTLVKTKSGFRFSKGEDDWHWWHASVPAKLQQLHAEGYRIVVLSNQAAISLREEGKTAGAMRSLRNFQGKVRRVLEVLAVPDVRVYAATAYDSFRKPRTGMWDRMIRDWRLDDETGGGVDLAESVFVGDAGGREGDKSAGVKKDHSCSDRDLAANVGIRFQTPEEFFLGNDPKPFVRSFEPARYLEDAASTSQTDSPAVLFSKTNTQDLVLFCGSPGAGKSTFYWRHMQPLAYERVNQDILKSRDRCMKVAIGHLEEGKSVVVDNTNADIETRAAWIGLARRLKVPVRLVHFTSSAKLCEHNDTVRALAGDLMNPEKRTMLPKMAFTGFAARYREPQLQEGFEDITQVDFKFEGTDEQRQLWKGYWIS